MENARLCKSGKEIRVWRFERLNVWAEYTRIGNRWSRNLRVLNSKHCVQVLDCGFSLTSASSLCIIKAAQRKNDVRAEIEVLCADFCKRSIHLLQVGILVLHFLYTNAKCVCKFLVLHDRFSPMLRITK